MNRLMQAFAQVTDLPIPKPELNPTTLTTVLKIVFGVAGAVAALIITIAAFQYVVSQGDPQSTAKAKNTIIYALIGLVICVTAFSIVTFVVGEI